MLSSLKLFLPLGLITINHAQGHVCPASPDLVWVDQLNYQASNLSESNQREAKAIVNNVLNQGFKSKSCTVAQDLARQGEESIRQTLMGTDSHQGLSQVDSKRNDFVYPNLLVFVSFSMPGASLKALHAQVTRLKGKLVLRGLINGSFRETAQKLKDLQIEAIIDPILFEAYQANSAQNHSTLASLRAKSAKKTANFGPAQLGPMFVLRGTPTNKADENVVFDCLTGNVSLEYVLEQFANNGETHSLAFELLKTLRGAQ